MNLGPTESRSLMRVERVSEIVITVHISLISTNLCFIAGFRQY